jgi:hypothetical protein
MTLSGDGSSCVHTTDLLVFPVLLLKEPRQESADRFSKTETVYLNGFLMFFEH